MKTIKKTDIPNLVKKVTSSKKYLELQDWQRPNVIEKYALALDVVSGKVRKEILKFTFPYEKAKQISDGNLLRVYSHRPEYISEYSDLIKQLKLGFTIHTHSEYKELIFESGNEYFEAKDGQKLTPPIPRNIYFTMTHLLKSIGQRKMEFFMAGESNSGKSFVYKNKPYDLSKAKQYSQYFKKLTPEMAKEQDYELYERGYGADKKSISFIDAVNEILNDPKNIKEVKKELREFLQSDEEKTEQKLKDKQKKEAQKQKRIEKEKQSDNVKNTERSRYIFENNIPSTISEFKDRTDTQKGSDIAKGDVVLFTENIFDFDGRRANFVGNRIILGLIEKESYGSKRGQHSFSIFVLDVDDNSIPTGDTISRKGRNVYETAEILQLSTQEARDEKHDRARQAKNAKYWLWWNEYKYEGKADKLSKIPSWFLKENNLNNELNGINNNNVKTTHELSQQQQKQTTMKITTKNLKEVNPKDLKNEGLREQFSSIAEMLEFYNDDNDIKEAVDLFIKLANKDLEKQEKPKPAPDTAKQGKTEISLDDSIKNRFKNFSTEKLIARIERKAKIDEDEDGNGNLDDEIHELQRRSKAEKFSWKWALNDKIEITYPKKEVKPSNSIINHDWNFETPDEIEKAFLKILNEKGVKSLGNKDWAKGLGVNEVYLTYKGKKFELLDNTGEFKLRDVPAIIGLHHVYFEEANTIKKVALEVFELLKDIVSQIEMLDAKKEVKPKPAPKPKKPAPQKEAKGSTCVKKGKNSYKVGDISVKLDNYLFDPKHPLMVCDPDSEQFKSALKIFASEIKEGNSKSGHWKLIDRFNSLAKKKPASKPAPSSKHAELPIEIRLIRRFLNFADKKVTKTQILNLIKSIERENAAEHFKASTSKYIKEVRYIHNELYELYNSVTANSFVFKLDEKDRKMLNSMIISIEQNKVNPAVTIIKAFISTYGKLDNAKARRLHSRIAKSLKSGSISKTDKHISHIRSIRRKLAMYIKSGTIELNKTELKGLAGIADCEVCEIKKKDNPIKTGDNVKTPFGTFGKVKAIDGGEAYLEEWPGNPFPVSDLEKTEKVYSSLEGVGDNDLVSSMDLKTMEFSEMGVDGKWKATFGNLEKPFSMMLYGGPGSGKSTTAIEFAYYLASKLNKTVEYIAAEEGVGGTIKEKFERLNAFHPGIFIRKSFIDNDTNIFDVKIFDSVQGMRLSVIDVENLIRKNKATGTSCIFIFRGTKDGSYRGSEEFENIVDISVKAENGIIVAQKNRYGGKEPMLVFEAGDTDIPKFTDLADAEKYLTAKPGRNIVKGSDNKYWIVSPAKAKLMHQQGFKASN